MMNVLMNCAMESVVRQDVGVVCFSTRVYSLLHPSHLKPLFDRSRKAPQELQFILVIGWEGLVVVDEFDVWALEDASV